MLSPTRSARPTRPDDWQSFDDEPVRWTKRLINGAVDLFLIWVSFRLGEAAWLVLQTAGWLPALPATTFVRRLIQLFVFISYYVGFEATRGQTPGKWLTRTRVVDMQGRRPALRLLLLRTLARLVPLDLASLWQERPIGWHDSVTATLVVDAHPTVQPAPAER